MQNKLFHPKYRADIDGLRAIAVLSVIGFHAFSHRLTGGFVGVDIFFVISGYLISTIIFESIDRNSFNFAEFYSRRIRRIFPSLIVVLLSCMVFGWFVLLADEYEQLGKHAAGAAGFVANFVYWSESGYFDRDAGTKIVLHLWSLGIEEQFYIVWPLVIWSVWKKRFDHFTIVLILIILSFLINLAGLFRPGGETDSFYLPQARFWELLIGCLAVCPKTRAYNFFKEKILQNFFNNGNIFINVFAKISHQRIIDVQSFFGVLMILGSITLINKNNFYPGWIALFPVIGTILTICAGPSAYLNRTVLNNKILVFFGLISYPLYLWHWPILTYVNIINGETVHYSIRLIAIVACVILAWLTCRFVENPIRFGNLSFVKSIPLVFLIAVLCGTGLLITNLNGVQQRKVVLDNLPEITDLEIAALAKTKETPLILSSCNLSSKYYLLNEICTSYLSPNTKNFIFIWGDSYADMWRSVISEIAKNKNYSLIVISHPSCPPLIGVRKTKFPRKEVERYCKNGEMQQQVVEFIRSIKPSFVILTSPWNSYGGIADRNDYIIDETGNKADMITSEKAIARKIPETIRVLSELAKVIVIESIPLLEKTPKYHTKRLSFIRDKSNNKLVSAEYFKKETLHIKSIFKNIHLKNVTFFDPAKRICNQICAINYNGIKMYINAYHFSKDGVMLYYYELEKLFDT